MSDRVAHMSRAPKQKGQTNSGKFKKKLRFIAGKWQLYVFLLLPLMYIVIFAYVPMTGLQLAFKRFQANLGVWGSPFIGFGNFRRFFTSHQFSRVVGNTLKLSFYGLFAGFPIPIMLALIVNALRGSFTKRVAQTITYLPYFVSTVVLVGMLSQMLNPRIGVIPKLYTMFTGGSEMGNLIGSHIAFPHLYVWSGVWQSMGYSAIIYIAALSGASVELHDAAEIDGASRFKRVLHIDLPAILPTASIMLILSAGQIMNVGFEKVFLMQNDMNIVASEVISTYIYKVGIASATADFAYGTTIGMFNSVINLILIVTVNGINKRINESSLF